MTLLTEGVAIVVEVLFWVGGAAVLVLVRTVALLLTDWSRRRMIAQLKDAPPGTVWNEVRGDGSTVAFRVDAREPATERPSSDIEAT